MKEMIKENIIDNFSNIINNFSFKGCICTSSQIEQNIKGNPGYLKKMIRTKENDII